MQVYIGKDERFKALQGTFILAELKQNWSRSAFSQGDKNFEDHVEVSFKSWGSNGGAWRSE